MLTSNVAYNKKAREPHTNSASVLLLTKYWKSILSPKVNLHKHLHL